MNAPRPFTILVFDSGLGGLTVLREIVKARPDLACVYLADDARFPYGSIPESELIPRVLDVIGAAVDELHPALVVVACNTASTLALALLREALPVPFVGTVPAIKPACAGSKTRMVSVLGTEATVAREYTKALIREFGGGCAVNLVGSARLASLAEAALNGKTVADAAIAAEIAPCFVEQDGNRTDAVVLACTHYPLLRERMERLAPWPVTWVDPAPAIARRVAELAGPPFPSPGPPPVELRFTSGRKPSDVLLKALPGFGIVPAPV